MVKRLSGRSACSPASARLRASPRIAPRDGLAAPVRRGAARVSEARPRAQARDRRRAAEHRRGDHRGLRARDAAGARRDRARQGRGLGEGRPSSRTGAVVAVAAGHLHRDGGVFALDGLRLAALLRAARQRLHLFWGFFAMAVILFLLGRAGRPARRPSASKRRRRRCRNGDRGGPQDPRDRQRRQLTRREGQDARADGPAHGRAEIRSSIEANRTQLAVSIEQLRGEVDAASPTGGRSRAPPHETLLIGAAVAGFLLGGDVCARRRPPAAALRVQAGSSSARGTAPTPSRPGPV